MPALDSIEFGAVVALVGGGRRPLRSALAGRSVIEASPPGLEPFSAPLPHEPQIPDGTTLVIAGIDAAALGKVIADRCPRPLRVAAAAGCSPYQRLTPERALQALSDPRRGWRKGVPVEARFLIAVTGGSADDPLITELLTLITSRGLTPIRV